MFKTIENLNFGHWDLFEFDAWNLGFKKFSYWVPRWVK
jgi:hypothetical protein